MANQYTDPKSPKAERSKDRVRAEMLAQRLYQFVSGEPDPQSGDPIEMDAVRVQAAKILIDKGKPNLSSIDTTMYDGDAESSPEEMKAKLRMLISKADPALLSEVLGERARQILSEVGKDTEQAA